MSGAASEAVSRLASPYRELPLFHHAVICSSSHQESSPKYL